MASHFNTIWNNNWHLITPVALLSLACSTSVVRPACEKQLIWFDAFERTHADFDVMFLIPQQKKKVWEITIFYH